jgi:hypothetical protein
LFVALTLKLSCVVSQGKGTPDNIFCYCPLHSDEDFHSLKSVAGDHERKKKMVAAMKDPAEKFKVCDPRGGISTSFT